MWRELRMEEIFSPRRTRICYNTPVPRKRGRLIFDIVLRRRRKQTKEDLGHKPERVDGKTPQNRADMAAERGVDESQPGLRHIRNSVLVLPGKPLLSRTRQEYDVAPYENHAAQPLSYVSSRLVVVPLGNRVSRVRRFPIPRQSGSTR